MKDHLKMDFDTLKQRILNNRAFEFNGNVITNVEVHTQNSMQGMLQLKGKRVKVCIKDRDLEILHDQNTYFTIR